MLRAPRALLALGLAAAVVSVGGAAQAADELSIDYVEPSDGGVQILVSVPPDAEVDPDAMTVTIAGKQVEASGELAAESDEVVRRTTILAMDTSNSMVKQGRFAAAKAAANAFLDTAPDDVYVGIVTFDSDVETVFEPALDRAAASEVVAGLELARATRLNDGVLQAVEAAGDEGQRTILLLSDGKDTSKTPAEDVIDTITEAEIQVNVVGLDQPLDDLAPLKAMSDVGGGSVISANAGGLARVFADEADSLARQVLVTASLPAGLTDAETTVQVTAPTESGTLSGTTYTIVQEATAGIDLRTLDPGSDGGLLIPKEAMYGGLAAMGMGMLLLFSGVVSVAGPKRPATVEDRIAAYAAGSGGGSGQHAGNPAESAAAFTQVKDAAATMLKRNRGLESRIENRLEASGSALRPSEWLLAHGGITMLAGLVGMLLGGGQIFLVVVFLVVGAVLPWVFLGFKRKRRLKAFNAGLADTLQLMSGSLSAGMSMAQSIDTVVREGSEPIAGEFKRVLIETRLGVTLEDALAGVAQRLESKDFAWVVMAIRIQREVGGNLAELLTIVAGTLRERDYLRRQIQTLAAEGKLSGYILGALPPGMLVYLVAVRREYVSPMFTETLGWAMLGGAAALLGLGAFMISRIVKMDV
ncbi:type II secretion system F family protein [Nocardioides donggukensis]|uniref:Type II secretion system F family protein n=1 Tax=Nocardioides donggukensis TaxID=2774019 RepID=A0A927K538_9ACTN|nr:type II secretion system F family protein [Nocardioides donggukensis]MBD8869153.1 type II secretion system F family protein [Nocardioides donggukensis]